MSIAHQFPNLAIKYFIEKNTKSHHRSEDIQITVQTISSNAKIIVAQAFFLFTTILRIFLTKLLCHSYSTEFQHHTLNEKSSECFNETVGISPLNSILFVLIQKYIHSQVFELLFRNAQIILFL